MEKEQDFVQQLSEALNDVLSGAPDADRRLESLTAADASGVSHLSTLAERINLLSVRHEIQLFRMEVLLEELLEARAALSAAQMDTLTGLPNRALFHEFLRQACADTKRSGGLSALLFIDLDHFKQVNDTMGHGAGDELLKQVATRLRACVRESDLLGRLGGDEFTAVLKNVGERAVAIRTAGRIVSSLQEEFALAEGPAQIGCSIGISFYPTDAERVTELIKNADMAMYRAKDAGRNGFAIYSPTLDEWQRDRAAS